MLLAATDIIRKRWWKKTNKRKHQHQVRDIFTDNTDSQYNKLLRQLRTRSSLQASCYSFYQCRCSYFFASMSESNIYHFFFRNMFMIVFQKICFYVIKLNHFFSNISVCQSKGLSICIPRLHWHETLWGKVCTLRHFLQKFFLFILGIRKIQQKVKFMSLKISNVFHP